MHEKFSIQCGGFIREMGRGGGQEEGDTEHREERERGEERIARRV